MLGNIGKLMSQMGNIKENMAKMEKELTAVRILGASEKQLVRVEVNGKLEILDVKLEDGAMKLSSVDLEKEIHQAVNKAWAQAKALAKDKIKDATGGIDIPGLM